MQASRCPRTYHFLPFFPFADSNPQPLEQIIKIHLYLICLLELIEFLRLANVTQYAMPPNRDRRCRCRGCSPEALPPRGHPWGHPRPQGADTDLAVGTRRPSSVAPGFQGPHVVRLHPVGVMLRTHRGTSRAFRRTQSLESSPFPILPHLPPSTSFHSFHPYLLKNYQSVQFSCLEKEGKEPLRCWVIGLPDQSGMRDSGEPGPRGSVSLPRSEQCCSTSVARKEGRGQLVMLVAWGQHCTWHSNAWHSTTQKGAACHGKEWHCMAQHRMHGMAWHSLAQLSTPG